MRTRSKRMVVIWILMVAVSALACSIGPRAQPTQTIPVVMPPEITPNPTAAARAKKNFNQALQEAKGGREVQFRITPEELTSLVTEVLALRAEIPVSNPQIWFADDNIYVRTDVQTFGGASISALLVMRPIVTDAGRMQVEPVSAKMGAFSIPEAIVDNITETANETLRDMPFNISVSAIEVRDNELIITATRTD